LPIDCPFVAPERRSYSLLLYAVSYITWLTYSTKHFLMGKQGFLAARHGFCPPTLRQKMTKNLKKGLVFLWE